VDSGLAVRFIAALLVLYCALRAQTWVVTRETKAILCALLGSAFLIGSDVAVHIVTPLTVFCVGGVWNIAAAWLGGGGRADLCAAA
jgi:hypothetical protein